MGVGNQLHSLSATTTYSVTVNIQGVGVESTPTLGLYVTPRGGTETLLKTEALTLTAFTDGKMTTSFTPPVTGEYTFRAAIESAIPSDSNSANNEATLDISGLPPGYSVSGRVQAKIYFSPIPWVEITDELGQKTFAKGDCLYTLKNIQPGNHTLTMVKDGVLFDPVTFEVTNANITDFALEGTPVKFKIFGSGLQVPGVVVSDGVGNQVLTDSIGRFATRNLLPGTYTLTFSKPGYLFSPSSVTVQVVDNDVYFLQNFVITVLGNNVYLPMVLRR
jgi:hypothetical protein